MKKVLAIWDTKKPHPKDEIEEAFFRTFPETEWDVAISTDTRVLANLPANLDLLVCFYTGRAEGMAEGEWYSEDVQRAILGRVENGMGFMFVHGGLGGYPIGSIMHAEIARGRFVHHPEHCAVSFRPVPAYKEHPVMLGVEPFAADDEHYHCLVDTDRTLPLAYAHSKHGTTVAAWTHQIGKGRVVCACPSHYKLVFDSEPMLTLLGNMARFATWQVG